ncbi:RimK-like protein [Bradyrhizobium sp. 83012]|uniref:RimK-like protein n=1 Tax=Bradyrhizobium aeschynomenes TaxID=2734909 RepID=A0ABX2CEL3_9BRAD|nr:RimK-like protein [Bradyrhizobium aeschynomenes]NPU66663.1 RimK-like protein [Bradyrhizobium aeschynomenes]
MINAPHIQLAAVTRYCTDRGIRLEVREDGWLLVLEDATRRHLLFGYDLGLNSAVAHRLACDKAATAALLGASGVPAIPHVFCLAPVLGGRPGLAPETIVELLETHPHGLVVKPNEGTSGRSVTRATTLGEALGAAKKIFDTGANVAISPLLDIADEVRVVQLDDAPLIVYRKQRPTVTGDGVRSLRDLALATALSEEHARLLRRLDAEFGAAALSAIVPPGEERLLSWRHNLEFGARPVLLGSGPPRDVCAALAREAAQAIGIRYASVDLVLVDGCWQVLEINSGVKMEALGPHAPELVESACFAALDAVFGGPPRQ